MRLAALLLLLGGVASAQTTRDPYEADEPTPQDPPPTIYVPIPPPIVAPMPYVPPEAMAMPPKKSSGGFVFDLDLLGSYRYALKESWGAGVLHMLIGGESGPVGFGGILDVELGGRALFYTALSLGFEFYVKIGEHLRIGLGPQFGGFIIVRRTNTNPSEDLSAAIVGVNAEVAIDLVHSKSTALMLIGRIRYDYIDTGPVTAYSHSGSGQLGVGIRF